MTNTQSTFWTFAVAIALISPVVSADEGDTLTVDAESKPAAAVQDDPETTPETNPEDAADPAGDASARDVMDQLLKQRREAPTIEPTRQPHVQAQPSRIGAPAATVDLDPAVVGIAPGAGNRASAGGGADHAHLLPEGTFVVNRRGRVIRTQDGAHVMFVFEADGRDTPETPMILQPCRKLQDMEDYVEKHGDQTIFRLSGQVHTYRNANYLMPTMMVIDINRGNLDS